MNIKSAVLNIISWISGFLFSFIGVVNMFWGNDPGVGIFIFLLSLVYYPPVNVLFKKINGRTIPPVVKIGLAVVILWASTGVGELFDKIDMMVQSF